MSEFMDVVDENDRVIGKETRSEIHRSGKWHRGVHVFVFNLGGQLLLPTRSLTKDKFPGTYDCSVSEHVQAGETFEEAALRGLKEELKIIKPELKRLLKFRMNYGPNDNTIAILYECQCEEKIEIDANEIREVEFLPLNKVRQMLTTNESKFTPWARELLKWYLHIPSKIKIIEYDKSFL